MEFGEALEKHPLVLSVTKMREKEDLEKLKQAGKKPAHLSNFNWRVCMRGNVWGIFGYSEY